MARRSTVCLLLTLFLLFSVNASAAATLHELANCRKTFSYSGSAAAYFYGFYGSTLVSSRVLPDTMTRTVTVPGNILCACHDDDNAYALYKESLHTFRVVQMNMHSGACAHTTVAENRTVQHTSIAAGGGELFVIVVENSRSFVLGQLGHAEYPYRFSHNIDRLFVSDNTAYARTDGGAVYRIGNGQAASVSGVAPNDSATTVCAGGQTATLQADFTCTVHTGSAAQSDGNTLTVAAGTTVRQLQTQYPSLTAVYNAEGHPVDSGTVHTGYSVQMGGSVYLLAVAGDVNGNGAVNSADADALMQHLIGSAALPPIAAVAADINKDGSVDHRDLVLLARAAS